MQKQTADVVEEGAAAGASAAAGFFGLDGWLRSHLPRLVWAAMRPEKIAWFFGTAAVVLSLLFAGFGLLPEGIVTSTIYRMELASPLPVECIGRERDVLETGALNIATVLDSYGSRIESWKGDPVRRSLRHSVTGFDVRAFGVIAPTTISNTVRLIFSTGLGDRPVVTLDGTPPPFVQYDALRRVVGPCVSIATLPGGNHDPQRLAPNTDRFWIIGTAAGLAGLLFGVLFRFTQAAYLHTMSHDLVRGFGLRVAGHLPYERRFRRAIFNLGRPGFEDYLDRKHRTRYWAASERVFTRLGLSDPSTRRPVIFVTGLRPMLGKSTLARALAFWASSIGLRTVLVDADMRRGMQHDFLRRTVDPGLSNYIAHMASFDQVLQLPKASPSLHSERIAFVARGLVPPNPTQLALRPELPALLAELQQRFDLVVVDLPPTFVADTKPIIASGGLVITVLPTAVPTWGRDDYLAELESLKEVGQPIVAVTSSAWGVHWSDGLGTSGFGSWYYDHYYTLANEKSAQAPEPSGQGDASIR